MRLRPLALMLVAVPLLAACGGTEPVPFSPDNLTFPVQTAGMHEHYFQEVVRICRETGDPDDPDCVLRVKGNRSKCEAAEAIPKVFKNAPQHERWKTKYMKCLDGRG